MDYVIKSKVEQGDAHIFNYGIESSKERSSIAINSCGLLDSRSIDQKYMSVIKLEIQNFTNWEEPKKESLPDLFSIVFFCLSRYEEYLSKDRDLHGRFSSQNSILSELDWLERPIIDTLLTSLTEVIHKKFGLILEKSITYDFKSTLDIDQSWAYRYKGFGNVLGVGKDILTFHWTRVINRVKVLMGFEDDPFYTFDKIIELHKKYNLIPIFFILGAETKSRHDRNHPLTNHYYRKLLVELSNDFEIGIHPSYQSNSNTKFLEAEISILRRLIGREVKISRQHFLKLDLPTTYSNLISAGILEDFTMGYADRVGYRAGTGYEFYWYDLVNNCSTKLKVQPFQVMDATLNFYLKLTPIEAQRKVLSMIAFAKKIDSPFCVLWHNSSFHRDYGWKGWEDVYEEVLKNGNIN